MSENERVVQKIIEATNRHDVDAALEYLAGDMTYVNPIVGTTDKNGFRKFLAGSFAAFPDIRYHVERTVSQGNTVVLECTVTGTQKGEFAGVPPTNKKVAISLAFVLELEAGKVKRWRTYFDTATIMRQLGAME